MYIPHVTHPEPRPSKGLDQRCLAPYAWLAAGVLVLGGAATLAEGAGVAHADVTASSDSAHSAEPANRSSGRNADHRPRAAATSARLGGTTPKRGSQQAALTAAAASAAPASTAKAPPAATALPTTTNGSASFSYTGGSQTWQVPAGVQSANVQVQGGFGGPSNGPTDKYLSPAGGLYAANVGATVALSGGTTPAITALTIVVGGGGSTIDYTNPDDKKYGGAGGFNGGGSGGSGSDAGFGGAGGGGATTVLAVGGPPAIGPVLVAGGGGGYGGSLIAGVSVGGAGGSAVLKQGAPSPDGVSAGNDGRDATGENGGNGGAGGTVSGGNGQNGGDAEDLSGNSGGGGGGGGYYGGGGGAAGQGDPIVGTAGSGGGGGSGSSYASPSVTSNAYAAPAQQPAPYTPVGENGNATVQWVSILSTALPPLTLGQAIPQQQLLAYYNGTSAVTWQGSGGALPAGLSLSSSGVLSGTPTKLGPYSYQATVSSVPSAQNPSVSSVMTYSGNVTAPTFRQVLANIVRWWREFIIRPRPLVDTL